MDRAGFGFSPIISGNSLSNDAVPLIFYIRRRNKFGGSDEAVSKRQPLVRW